MGVMGIFYFDWTDEAVEDLRTAISDGMSSGEFALAHPGCSRAAAIGKAHRLGLSFRGGAADGASNRKAREGRHAKAQPSAPRATRAPKVEKPPPTPVLRKAPDLPARQNLSTVLAVSTLGRHACKWPIGDPADPGFGFCGAPAAKSYCAEHAELSRSKTARAFAPDKVAGAMHSSDALGPIYRY